jgi:glycosyltransferase involved in cell wall biosynthesis
MNPDAPEIGYILKGYLRTSETFITSEISLLEDAGLKLHIFSLKKLEGQQPHAVADRISAAVTFLPPVTPAEQTGLLCWLWQNLPGFVAAHRRLLRLRPRAWFSVLAEALHLSWRYRNRAFIREFLQAGFIAQRVIESGRIRHLHAHFCHTSTTVAMFASRLCSVPFSFTAHAKDIYREDMNPGDLLALKMQRARFVVTCTGANQQYLAGFNRTRIPIYRIYHGLDLTLFSPPEKRNESEAHAPLILAVGRLVEKKGFSFLVEACRMLKERGYDFECRIVGGADSESERISRMIAELHLTNEVTLHGAVTQEELCGIYQQADIFALPCQVLENGDRDGIPNVLVEAMAMRLPVVSTAISGIPELIADRCNGLLVPQKDAAALADAIEKLLLNPALRRELGEQARSTVVRRFDARQNVQQLKRLFDNRNPYSII